MSKLILVITPTVDTFIIVQDRVVSWGYKVMRAMAGTESLNVLETFTVHGVMVELKGTETMELTFLAELHKQYPLIPILVIGDQEAKPILIRALESGANDFLVKPIDMDLMWRKCYRLFP